MEAFTIANQYHSWTSDQTLCQEQMDTVSCASFPLHTGDKDSHVQVDDIVALAAYTMTFILALLCAPKLKLLSLQTSPKLLVWVSL